MMSLWVNIVLIKGRTAESPIRVFNLLLKSIYTISDVDVIERSRYDMSFKYFLEMSPKDEVVNPSSLTKFRKLRLKDAAVKPANRQTVPLTIEKEIIKFRSLIVYATHSLSRSNMHSVLELLAEHSKLVREAVYAVDPEISKR